MSHPHVAGKAYYHKLLAHKYWTLSANAKSDLDQRVMENLARSHEEIAGALGWDEGDLTAAEAVQRQVSKDFTADF